MEIDAESDDWVWGQLGEVDVATRKTRGERQELYRH
jgi:hypothetical protein